MKKNIFLFLCIVILQTLAQSQIQIPIRVSETGTALDSVIIGIASGATYGLDTTLGEHELPPTPPLGLYDVRMTNIPSRNGLGTPLGLGEGVRYDLRPSQFVDTFRVQWQIGIGSYPVTLSWQSGLSLYADSIRMVDEAGGVFVNVNMLTTTSAIVTQSIVKSLLIFFYPRPTSVQQLNNNAPSHFSLEQNFPNPFNPTTQIQFAVPSTEFVSLKIYNLIGQEIQTLVSEIKSHGTYSAQFDASQLPSGVYLSKLNVGRYSDVKKMILMK